MAEQQDFKIRVLPRKNEKVQPAPAAPPKPPRWIIYVGTAAVVALVGAFTLPVGHPQKKVRTSAAKSGQADLSSYQDPINMKVTRHLQDAQIKEEIMRRRQQLDGLRLRDPSRGDDEALLDDSGTTYGVQMDTEDSVDKVYKDLNYRKSQSNNDFLPDERIGARLATRKWVNEQEKAERINFIRNFIRSAYDRGYAVQLDQNLVVVGVRKVTEPKKVNIDQVIDNMAKQGL
jgi:hypothetical protein